MAQPFQTPSGEAWLEQISLFGPCYFDDYDRAIQFATDEPDSGSKYEVWQMIKISTKKSD